MSPVPYDVSDDAEGKNEAMHCWGVAGSREIAAEFLKTINILIIDGYCRGHQFFLEVPCSCDVKYCSSASSNFVV